MSEESRKQIKEGTEHLETAKEYLAEAGKKFAKAGDKGTAETITKIQTEVKKKGDPKQA